MRAVRQFQRATPAAHIYCYRVATVASPPAIAGVAHCHVGIIIYWYRAFTSSSNTFLQFLLEGRLSQQLKGPQAAPGSDIRPL